MTASEIVQTLRIKVANIGGEANSGRPIPPSVLALGLAEIQDLLKELAAKVGQ